MAIASRHSTADEFFRLPSRDVKTGLGPISIPMCSATASLPQTGRTMLPMASEANA